MAADPLAVAATPLRPRLGPLKAKKPFLTSWPKISGEVRETEEMSMADPVDAARSLRESAARLRQIAVETETPLSAQLLQLVHDLIKEAAALEGRKGPPPADGDGAEVPT